jgi:hypothetical protein
MRETLKSTLMFAKHLGKNEEDSSERVYIKLDCPECGKNLFGVQNNVTHNFENPMKRCKCDCGYKGFYPAIEEDNKDGME